MPCLVISIRTCWLLAAIWLVQQGACSEIKHWPATCAIGSWFRVLTRCFDFVKRLHAHDDAAKSHTCFSNVWFRWFSLNDNKLRVSYIPSQQSVRNHALDTVLPFENDRFCSFQSADVLTALLKNWTRCEWEFSDLVNVSKGSILHLNKCLNSGLYL